MAMEESMLNLQIDTLRKPTNQSPPTFQIGPPSKRQGFPLDESELVFDLVRYMDMS